MTYAQYGEDDILWRFFAPQTDGFFIEAGALDGVFLSNTKLLEDKGWRGLLIEPDRRYLNAPDYRPKAKWLFYALVGDESIGSVTFYESEKEALSTVNIETVHALEKEGVKFSYYRVAARTLDSLLRGLGWVFYGKLARIDLLSIDCDGTNDEVLQGANIPYWRPRVVLIEIVNKVEQIGIPAQMAAAGYHLAHVQAGENHFYVRDVEDVAKMQEAARNVSP